MFNAATLDVFTSAHSKLASGRDLLGTLACWMETVAQMSMPNGLDEHNAFDVSPVSGYPSAVTAVRGRELTTKMAAFWSVCDGGDWA